MKYSVLLLIAQTLVVPAKAAENADTRIIGVPPRKHHLYQLEEGQKFKCLSDPSIEIDISKVNDGYCDCPDGSDEPGTAACANIGETKFYCANSGFKPSYISSSKVNDGVCDYDLCCDGSDEWNTTAECENKCLEMAYKYQFLKDQKISKLTNGLAIKNELLKKVELFDSQLKEKIDSESLKISGLNDDVYALKKQVQALNLEYNTDAVEFLNNLKSNETFNSGEIEIKIHDILENIRLIKKGAVHNQKKIEKAHDILQLLSDEFDFNINDVAVKQVISDFNEIQNDSKYSVEEFEKLENPYNELYELTIKDFQMFNMNFLLDQNRDHLHNWQDFIMTRKSDLHAALLKLLLLQDEVNKKYEELFKTLELDHNPNFNNDVVKTCLKEIKEYNEFREYVQENILSKIDYAAKYESAIKSLNLFILDLETKLNRTEPYEGVKIYIDDKHTEAELNVIKEEKLRLAKEKELEDLKNYNFFADMYGKMVYAFEDFIGVYDNLPVSETKHDLTAFDIVSNKLHIINDLSKDNNPEYKARMAELNKLISEKQQNIVDMNQEVAEMMDELTDKANKYGPGKVLKAVENETFRASIGEYEYEIDFLGKITQQGNNQNVMIGQYDGTVYDIENSKNGKLLQMLFRNGAKCWSGPIREARVTVVCGEKVEILKVTEPEICKYFIDVTSPIACFAEELQKLREAEEKPVEENRDVLNEKAEEEEQQFVNEVMGDQQKDDDTKESLEVEKDTELEHDEL